MHSTSPLMGDVQDQRRGTDRSAVQSGPDNDRLPCVTIQHLQYGELRPSAYTATDAASTRFLSVPAFDEVMPGAGAAPAWLGLPRPKGVPSEIVAKVSAEVHGRLIRELRIKAE